MPELGRGTQEGVQGDRNHQPREVCVAPNFGQTCFSMQRVVVNAESYSWSKYSVCSLEHGSSIPISILTVPEKFAEGALDRMEGEPCPTHIRGTTGSKESSSLIWTQPLVCYLPCECPHTNVYLCSTNWTQILWIKVKSRCYKFERTRRSMWEVLEGRKRNEIIIPQIKGIIVYGMP